MACVNIEDVIGRYKTSEGMTLFVDYEKSGGDSANKPNLPSYNISSEWFF